MKRISIVFCLLLVLVVCFGCHSQVDPRYNELPEPPSHLYVSDVSQNSLSLYWTKAVDQDGEVIDYNIYISTEADDLTQTIVGKTKSTNIIIEGLEKSSTYYFTVKSVDNWGYESKFGIKIMATTISGYINAPGWITASINFANKIELTWGVVNNADTYHVYRSLNQNSEYIKIDTTTLTTYEDLLINVNTVYYYKLKVSSNALFSDFSGLATGYSGTENFVFLTKWGSFGTGTSQFWNIRYIDIDTNGNVYVADQHNHCIQKFDSNGNYISQWGTQGTGNGQLYSPNGIAIDKNGNIYVADHGNHRIQKFDSNGNYISQWGTQGTGNGQFNFPHDIAIDKNNIVYVTEGNHRVQKFDSNGNYISQWGTEGTGNGQFDHPHGITVDNNDNVYVVDTDNDRIQKFDTNGNYIRKWGGFGSENGHFNSPHGIDCDVNGNIYVVDYGNHRIQKFISDGTFISSFSSHGSSDGLFELPVGISITTNGYIYVSDQNNFRVQKFLYMN